MDKPLSPAKIPAAAAFSACELGSDYDEQFFILNFGTRLLTAFTDREILVDIALETLADFSRGERLAILSLDDKRENLESDGIFSNLRPSRPRVSFPVPGTFLEKVMLEKAVAVHPLVVEREVPLPVEDGPAGKEQCLCLPLVGASFRVVGLATVAVPADHPFTFFETQQLRILSTVLAVSLENARLFSRVITDSLTGLYTRRFYEIRLEEELYKLKRRHGCLSLIMFDLDDFKKVNDSFGHLAGDDVLRQFGRLMQEHTRKGSTLVSRYGGEEFTILMPDARLEEAVALAHRIMNLCANSVFGDETRPIRLTVSGGVACTDSTESLDPKAFFSRADAALYKAKNEGRNRIVIGNE